MLFERLFRTTEDYVLTISRIVLGIIFIAHGAQLMLGWFGGHGFRGSMQYFTESMGIPPVFAFLAIASQFFGGIMLIIGLAARLAAFGIICTMLVAIAMVHWQFGFFMNWTGAQKGEGFEYHLLAIMAGVLILVRGAGAISLDGLLLQLHGHGAEAAAKFQKADAPAVTPRL